MTLKILTLISNEASTLKLEDCAVRFRDSSLGLAKTVTLLPNFESCRR
jgi:hypothetical protein